MTTPVSRSTLKNKLCIGARPSGHVRESDVIKDVKAIIRKLKKLNKNNTSSILVHEGHLYFHLWPGSISNQGIKGLIKGSRCFYFTRVLPYIFGSLGMSGSYSKLAKDQSTETSTIKPLKSWSIFLILVTSGRNYRLCTNETPLWLYRSPERLIN